MLEGWLPTEISFHLLRAGVAHSEYACLYDFILFYPIYTKFFFVCYTILYDFIGSYRILYCFILWLTGAMGFIKSAKLQSKRIETDKEVKKSIESLTHNIKNIQSNIQQKVKEPNEST